MAFYMKMGSKSLKASGINMNGTPLKKCGDPGEPPCTQPSQATADAAAEKSVDNANRVYDDDFKETGRKKVTGGTEVRFERDYNQTGTGEANAKPKNLPSYASVGVTKEEGDAYWQSQRSKSGTETKTRMIADPIRINPAGLDLPPMQPEAETLIPLTPKKITYNPVDAPKKELKTSSSGSSTTNKRKIPKKKKGRSLTGAKIEDFFTAKGRCPGGC